MLSGTTGHTAPKLPPIFDKCFPDKCTRFLSAGNLEDKLELHTYRTNHHNLTQQINAEKRGQNLNAPETGCNCHRKSTCPLKGKSQTKGIVYLATVERAVYSYFLCPYFQCVFIFLRCVHFLRCIHIFDVC